MFQAQLFIDGCWADGMQLAKLRNKFTGEDIAEVHEASESQVKQALEGVARGQQRDRIPPYERYRVLGKTGEILTERRKEFIDTVVLDTGFTITDAEREVDRAIETLVISGEESKRIHGEVVPLDGAPGGEGRFGFTVRSPMGVVCAITPFNSPLNTVVHKVAPALAAGNAVIIKPASYTPLSTNLLVTALLEAGLPGSLIAVVQGPGATVGEWLLTSAIPAFYAFTGSTEVGEHIQRTVGLRKTQLELGSLSSTFVCNDANLDHALPLCLNAAFRKAGQVCTSVQRLYVERAILPEVTRGLTQMLSGRTAGDPNSRETFVGPVISSKDADRIESWIGSAVARGASVVSGGTRVNQVIAPTLLSDVTLDMDVMSREIFGPVVSLRPFDELDEAIAEVNSTPFGLSAGIFTSDISRAMTAAQDLRMGSVHINQTSSNRVDLMPYGGVKRSGMGLEGPRYAIEEMTEQRLITIGRP